MRVPARLLRDELLDQRDALWEFEGRASYTDSEEAPREWQRPGWYDHEVEVGTECTVEDYTHNGARGGHQLSVDGEPWTWLTEGRHEYRLSQSRWPAGQHNYWERYPGDVSGTISRTAVEAFCRAIPAWSDKLSPSALFALFTDEIIDLGPRAWAEALGLEVWNWAEPRPIP